MAQLARLEGAAAEFLAARRDDLNRRFERARRRWPRLDPAAFLELVATVLPPLAGSEPGAADLCTAVYDLALLHAGRDTLGSPGVSHLLREAFPRLRPLLLARPGALPAALSNAVENLGARGLGLSVALASLGPRLPVADALPELCAVVAWQLGEARLRVLALEAARKLPPAPLLAALGLSDWPEAAAPAAIAALDADAWTHPHDAISRATLSSIRVPEDGVKLARAVAARPPAPLSKLAFAGTAGEFEGFGGAFARPPLVLDGGDRHALHARAGEGAEDAWRLDADVFGAVASRIAPPDFPVRAAEKTPPRLLGALVSKLRRGDGISLAQDGTLTLPGQSVRLPELAGAASFAVLGDAVVTSRADSHRLRVFVPRRDPL